MESRIKRLRPDGNVASSWQTPLPNLPLGGSGGAVSTPSAAAKIIKKPDAPIVRNISCGSADEATAASHQLRAEALVDDLLRDRFEQSGVASAASYERFGPGSWSRKVPSTRVLVIDPCSRSFQLLCTGVRPGSMSSFTLSPRLRLRASTNTPGPRSR